MSVGRRAPYTLDPGLSATLSHVILDKNELVALVARAQAGDETARARVVASSQRLVHCMARRWHRRAARKPQQCRLELEDLIAEGNMGLLRGIEKFRPDAGASFNTYACVWIESLIRRALIEQGRMIRLPPHVASGPGKVAPIPVASLDALVYDDDSTTLHDRVPAPRMNHDEGLLREEVAALLGRLPERERFVLERRYGLDGRPPDPLRSVGVALGISRERVRQLEVTGLRRLRDRAKRDRVERDS